MAVSATRWRQDSLAQPTNPYQRLRWYPTFPSGGGGYSTFGWSPIPLQNGSGLYNSPAGILTPGGLSGALGIPLLPSTSGLAKVAGAIAGIAGGIWLARKNMKE